MFDVIEFARMMVGTKAIATLSTGYLNALDYAKTRIHGADLTRMTDKTALRVPIIRHPDVRRSLMLQKAYTEGLRAIYLYTTAHQNPPTSPSRCPAPTHSWPRGSTTCCCRSSRVSVPNGPTCT